MVVFRDRVDAGERLAGLLTHLGGENPIVLALPRGGVPVAVQVGRALGAPVEILVSRKLGVPMQPELGFGALSEGGAAWVEESTRRLLGIEDDQVEQVKEKETRELARRVAVYRGGAPLPDLRGKTVIVVDDGVATGGTMRAAVRAARALGAGRVVAAVPVAAKETADALRGEVDEWVCVEEPEALWAIGLWYQDFGQLSDGDVLRWLGREEAAAHGPPGG